MDRERIRQIANECGLPPGGEYASWTEIAHFGWTVAKEVETVSREKALKVLENLDSLRTWLMFNYPEIIEEYDDHHDDYSFLEAFPEGGE